MQITVKQCASDIGVSVYYLYRLIKDGKLTADVIGGKQMLDPHKAYKVISALPSWRGRGKKPIGLKAPGIDPAPEIDPDEDIYDQIRRAFNDKRISNDDKRAMTVMADCLRKKEESDAKQKNLMHLDDVVKLMQDTGQLYIDEIQRSYERTAQAILSAIDSKIGIDIAAKNAASAGVIGAVLCEAANETIRQLRQHVASQQQAIEAEKK